MRAVARCEPCTACVYYEPCMRHAFSERFAFMGCTRACTSCGHASSDDHRTIALPCHHPATVSAELRCAAVVCCGQVVLSVVEIYCERVRDLLDPMAGSGSGGGRDNLAIKQDPYRGVYVEGTVLLSH